MKKLFNRDKKVQKVVPGSKDLDLANATVEEYTYVPERPANVDRAYTSPPPDEHWNMVDNDSKVYTVRSASYVAPQPPPNNTQLSTPRAVSPATSTTTSLANAVRSPNGKERDREPNVLRKKSNTPNAFAAIGILKSLDPHIEHGVQPEPSEDGMTEASFRDEKKERKGFWERTGIRDKDKERAKEREREMYREKEKREEDQLSELTRMIGYLTATASEDWSLVLEVCERASASEANARQAAKALRQEFKYAEPAAQLSAARLWAIMLRNSSEVFIHQCASRKFLDTLEDVITSSRTSPVVRERLLEVLAAAAYAGTQGKEAAFRALWKKVKPADKPEQGIPFDASDAMFQPPTPRNAQSFSASDHSPRMTPQRPPATVTPGRPKASSRSQVIPLEEDIRRLFEECSIGRNNAAVLSEALAFARPEDLKTKPVIVEWYTKCRRSLELISGQIPWAFAGAEKSRQAAAAAGKRQSLLQPRELRPSMDSERDRESGELTVEENLLAALLAANEELTEVFRVYDDLERIGIERQIERDAEERSRKEVRMDRSQLQYQDNDSSAYLDPNYLNHNHTIASSSRSPSPSQSTSPSPAPSFVITGPVNPPANHPLPPLPTDRVSAHQMQNTISSHGSIQSLAPPPHAPMGPRSPTHSTQPRSRTPSPERPAAGSRSPTERTNGLALHLNALRLRDDGTIDDEPPTPIRPSAKALGKRKVVEPIEPERTPYETDDPYFEHHEDITRAPEDPLESDSDEARQYPAWHTHVNYVYDAAAERTQQRIKEGRLAAAALVSSVH